MASLMDTLVDRRANKNAGLMPFSAPTYAQVRCFFGSIVTRHVSTRGGRRRSPPRHRAYGHRTES